MEGCCPDCGRRFDISEDFLAMGGKAKCPHCLLELDFGDQTNKGEQSEVTRVVDQDYPSMAAENEEVEAVCPNCQRYFKVDVESLEGADPPECLYCEVALKVGQPEDGPAVAQAEDLFEDEDSQDDSSNEHESTSQEPKAQSLEEELWGSGSDEQEMAEEESTDEDDIEDQEVAEEEEEDDDETIVTEGENEAEAEEHQELESLHGHGDETVVVNLSQGLIGLDEEEEAKGLSESISDSPGLSENELFSDLASKEDWESSKEYPAYQPAYAEATAGQGADKEASPEPMLVEVGDDDIIEVEQSSPWDAPKPPEPQPQSTPKKRQTHKIRKLREEGEQAEYKAKTGKPIGQSIQSFLSSPLVIASAIGVVALAGGLYFMSVMQSSEDIKKAVFSVENLDVVLVEAPNPLEYKTRDEARVHYGRGNRFAYRKDFESAVEEYKQAIRADGGYPHPHRALGAVYAAMGKQKLSVAEYKKYLRLAPNSVDAELVKKIVNSN
jgi:tetratricopeptide (TPR) repeat protein